MKYGSIIPLLPDLSGTKGVAVEVRPADASRMGSDIGGTLLKILGKYVIFSVEWNGPTDVEVEDRTTQIGTYDFNYCYANALFGPYSTPRVAVRHGGHGSVCMDGRSNWWGMVWGNGNDFAAPNQSSPSVVPLSVELIGGELIIETRD